MFRIITAKCDATKKSTVLGERLKKKLSIHLCKSNKITNFAKYNPLFNAVFTPCT